MKSVFNFKVKYEDTTTDMHDIGVWVESFHIYSPNVSRTKLTSPGMAGSYLSQSKEEERHVSIGLQIEADTLSEFDSKKHQIYELFCTEKKFSIVRDITPEKEIFVLQEGEYDIENITKSDGVFNITLTMLDPYIYGPVITADFNGNNVVEITNNGTADAEPVFELEVLAPITFAMIQNQNNDYMMIGRPVDVEKYSAVEEYITILDDELTDTTAWTAGSNIDGGTVAGTIVSDGTGFVPDTWGYAEGWHGPALKTSLSEVLTDFRVEARFEFDSSTSPDLLGRVGIHLLDETDQFVASATVKDVFPNAVRGQGVIRAGDVNVGYNFLEEEPYWNRARILEALVRIERRGHEWEGYIAEIIQVNGRHHTRVREFHMDSEQQFVRKLAQVQVHFGTRWSYTAPAMKVNNLKVEKINNLTSDQIPYIAKAGDFITFDNTNNGEVLINGEPFEDIAFGSTFFPLKPYRNQLVLAPDSFNAIA
ncbi:Phage tail protein [Thalassobacillus cyri]|uniref:Phage tail protein n=1 Tax=Thalassobacillus cyri TaxID=571932 RepID=A0A1H4H1T7_9BACI|nr:phage tail domain-containing protein [Thalassobacillus cyri]SEB15716.1 Phage tail protein [Thalassobacillus cyri]